MTEKSVTGRLAARRWQAGDPLPDVGSFCLVSGVNCDVESDQHRSYMWRKVVGYSDDSQFVCLQTEGCWPTVERTDNCWFAETDGRRLAFEKGEVARGNNVGRDDGGLYLNQFVQERWEDYAAEKPAESKSTFMQQFDDSKKRAAKLRAMYPALSVGSIDKQAEPVGDEHYDEVKATLEGAHTIMESLSAIERRVGPVGSHARGYTHKITNALKHLNQMRAAQSGQRAAYDAPAYYVRQVHEGHLPEFNTVDEFSDGLGGGEALYSKPQGGQRAGVAEDARDAARYRAIRACGEEWSGLRVFDARGAIDPESLDEEADGLRAAAPTPAAQGGEHTDTGECRSPYCECEPGKCGSGRVDKRGSPT